MNNTEESLTTISEQSQINDLTNLEIQDIEGIGPTTAKKLREAGIFSVMDLAVAGVEDLAVDINASKDSAASFIMAAQKLLRESDVLDKEFITAETALKKRRSLLRCSTGSSMLDDLFLGGIETLHRAEFSGRGTLADRQQRLNSIMHKLLRISEIYNVAIIVTNQVQSAPDTFFGDPTKPTGGNVIGHASTYRVYLRKSGENRVAKMIDSPYHPYSEVRFTINEKGTDNLDEGKKSKKE